MIDTPRTDKVVQGEWLKYEGLARQLERELNAAKGLIREIRDNEVNAVDEATKFLRDYPIK